MQCFWWVRSQSAPTRNNKSMNIFGIGPGELILVLLITLVVVGPERLPDLARRGGQLLVRARNWLQASPDAQMVLRMRQELEQELAQIRTSLSEVQAVREEVIGAARQATQTISQEVVEPVKQSMMEVKAATDTVARSAKINGQPAEVPTAAEDAAAPVEQSIAPPDILRQVAESTPPVAPPLLDDGPEHATLQQISAQLQALADDLRATQEALRRRGLLDDDWLPPSATPSADAADRAPRQSATAHEDVS